MLAVSNSRCSSNLGAFVLLQTVRRLRTISCSCDKDVLDSLDSSAFTDEEAEPPFPQWRAQFRPAQLRFLPYPR